MFPVTLFKIRVSAQFTICDQLRLRTPTQLYSTGTSRESSPFSFLFRFYWVFEARTCVCVCVLECASKSVCVCVCLLVGGLESGFVPVKFVRAPSLVCRFTILTPPPITNT